jgi:hypothetical protein
VALQVCDGQRSDHDSTPPIAAVDFRYDAATVRPSGQGVGDGFISAFTLSAAERRGDAYF